MSFSIRRGDIFYVHKFGIQVGSEEHTGRPGVVVSCDEGNRYSETVQVAFCTTQPKSNLPTHVEILSTGIEYMKALWWSFPESGKPEWLTLEEIKDYERRMAA